MANVIEFARCLLLSVLIVYALSHGFIEGVTDNIEAVKTIKSKDGDVIDCVDIYKQPAFDHPLLKNHKIQVKPSLYPNGMKSDLSETKITQNWNENGRCPEGTIPILRTDKKRDIVMANTLRNHKTKFGDNFTRTSLVSTRFPHEYAIVSQYGDKFYGGHASINVWNPTVGNPSYEFSLSQIWILSGQSNSLNSAEAGWQVCPLLYGDTQTRLFVSWTADYYQSTGCYNLRCPGFVQVNNEIALGSAFNVVSIIGGTQQELSITIYKDKSSGNWWLRVQDKAIGYWPSSIYTSLADSANAVQWGGEIVNSRPQGRHTTTQMGSGRFSNEGNTKASYIRDLQTVDASNTLRAPTSLKPSVTNAACYDLYQNTNYIYYGGPGYSQNCP